jgi:hypothetical protein
MKVNITLVTTSTWPGVGVRRFGLGSVSVPDGAASDALGEGSAADISRRFRGESIRRGLAESYRFYEPVRKAVKRAAARRELTWPALQRRTKQGILS